MRRLNFVQIARKYGLKASVRYLDGPCEVEIATPTAKYRRAVLAYIDLDEILEEASLKCDMPLVQAITEAKRHTWEELFGPSWTH